MNWSTEAGLDSTMVNGKPAKRSIAENDKLRIIDFGRRDTHRIYNVSQELKPEVRSMTRDSHFSFTQDKTGKKTYKNKDMEFKVEMYQDEKAKAAHSNRKRIGTRHINLAAYIG